MDYQRMSQIFKALGDPKRLQIVDLLAGGELCACELLAYFKCTQPTLSHHMKILTEAELVQARKQGTWNHYSLNKTALKELAKLLTTVVEIAEQKEC